MTREEYLRLDVGDMISTNSNPKISYIILESLGDHKFKVIQVTDNPEEGPFEWEELKHESTLKNIQVIWAIKNTNIKDSLKEQIQNKFKILKDDTIKESTSNS